MRCQSSLKHGLMGRAFKLVMCRLEGYLAHFQYSWKQKRCQNPFKGSRQGYKLYRNSWLRRPLQNNLKKSSSESLPPLTEKKETRRRSLYPSHRTLEKTTIRYRLRLLVVGFGDIAHRLARYLGPRIQIVALSRSKPSIPHVRWKRANLDTRSVGCFPQSGYLGLIYFAPPPSHGKTDPRLRHLLARLHVEHSVYISTTGVYGNQAGRWIDETQPINPQSERAQRRADAEGSFRKWGKSSNCIRRVMILRTPGIYAADRLPIERLKSGTPALQTQDDVYTNHIHADDLARLAWWTLFRGRSQRIYNACDKTSMKMGDYFDTVAQALEHPSPPRVSRSELAQLVSPIQRSFMEESRRIHNLRVLQELRFKFCYPDLSSWLKKQSN